MTAWFRNSYPRTARANRERVCGDFGVVPAQWKKKKVGKEFARRPSSRPDPGASIGSCKGATWIAAGVSSEGG